ncbi:bifunctional enoyl-CoA hydratase/phosphate acetyltransferase [Ahrensia marina]|uniref:bifunctional enoyl-CoA hydratase/phosphate acetyltransferase n=1 Tax=Ahrensia marina TaxID=1514904 RepID=UPI0035CE9BDB
MNLSSPDPSTSLANTPFDQLRVGQSASIVRLCTANDLIVFAHASGNLNPIHLPSTDTTGDGVDDAPIAPGMWLASLISSVLGNHLPGPGSLYLSQTLTFAGRARVGDELTVKVTVAELSDDRQVTLVTRVKGPDGVVLVEGEAKIQAPDEPVYLADIEVPDLQVQKHRHFDAMLELAQSLEPLPVAVVAPDDPNSLGGALLARDEGLIKPILVGSKTRIHQAAETLGAAIDDLELIDIDDEPASAACAVGMVHEGRVNAVMKGHMHTDGLLKHVVKADGGLRTGKRISHVFVMDVPGRPQPIIITDAAINITPDLKTKVDIVQNAINIALAIGIETPKVGILSAVETVNPAIPSTLDAAVLSKMADRGQIKGGIVDGPLAMDNAVDIGAARTKGIGGLVAGHANVLVAPNLEAGNMLAKELTFLAHAEAAGLLVGASVPVILTSRADDDKARLASCALAALYGVWLRTGKPVKANLFKETE